jgi:lipopolysaccharide/colanic/teichoic acid biosynthesis glycosyltransferase
LFVGRKLEIAICLMTSIVAIPLLMLTWLIVLLHLGAPAFFVQLRSGKGGTPIWLVKFRTMTDARDAAGNLLPDKQRATRITTALRRLRFDELPQLFSIIAGRMALVGPRPLLPETIAGFGEAGRLRGQVRPGLTGWAQVSGNTTLSDDEKLKLDLWYVSHRSTQLDLRILAETVGVVLLGEQRRPERLTAAAAWLAIRFAHPMPEAGP